MQSFGPLPYSFELIPEFALLSCYQDCADIIWKNPQSVRARWKENARANVSGNIKHCFHSIPTIQSDTVSCKSLPLKGWHPRHHDQHRSVPALSHGAETAPAKPILLSVNVLCLFHKCVRSVACSRWCHVCVIWRCICLMTGVSKCDCLMALLLDLAVKRDWHPSYMFDTDWQSLRVPKFQTSHSCFTRY